MPGIIEEYKQSYDEFIKNMEEVEKAYQQNKDLKSAKEALHKLASKYKKHYGICLTFLQYGTRAFDKGDMEYGFHILQTGVNTFQDAPKDTGICLRFVQYYMENGEINEEKAEKWLLELCYGRSNYDESIEWSGLSEIWGKYKYLVEGKVPLPLSQRASQPKSPEECTKNIRDIIEMSKDDMLLELSKHLDEMSVSGEEMSYLNKWEKIFYYADTLLSETGSGGVEAWLHSHGHKFEQTKKALQAIGATVTLRFLEEVEKKFPRGKVPKSYNRIENILDKMLDNDKDFEEEEAKYYWDAGGEVEMVDCLYNFVLDNKNKFR